MRTLCKAAVEKNIEKIATYDLENNNVFGCSYIVRQNGKTVCKRHFGVSDPDKKTAVDDNTIFRLASMTKPITAAAILILVDKGLLTLDTPVKSILPKFSDIHVVSPEGTDLGRPKTDVAILHLLSHTSGFGSLKPVVLNAEEMRTIGNTIDRFIKLGLDFEPFSRESYSAYAAFDVLAAVVETLTGEDYEDFLKKEIFEPCGMKDTAFTLSEEQWARMTVMHNKIDGESRAVDLPQGCLFDIFPATHKLGGAGLASTLDDYSAFAEALLHKVKENKTFAMMAEPFKPIRDPGYSESWGLGVRVVTKDTYPYLPVGCFGWSGAWGTHFWCDPENNVTAVYMKNSQFDGGAGNCSSLRFEKAVYDLG